MKRKFYIIGQNPNTVWKAMRCLEDGANAIEPDIRYLPQYEDKFFIYDLATINRKAHTFKEYLIELSAALNAEKHNLALLAFVLKRFCTKNMERDSAIYKKEFFDQLNEYFFETYTRVLLLLTVGKPSGKTLLAAAKPRLRANQAVGVDGGEKPRDVISYIKKEQMPFTFAADTSSPFASPVKYKQSIKEAIALKQQTDNLKLVNTRKVNSQKTMQYYLDMGVDGMITGKVTRLRNLVDTRYKDQVELATADYNPLT
jgi:hypothetical protein